MLPRPPRLEPAPIRAALIVFLAQVVLEDLQKFVTQTLEPVAGVHNLLLELSLPTIEMVAQIGGNVGGRLCVFCSTACSSCVTCWTN